MAIYTKHGKKIINDSIHIDGECYFADKVIKMRALVEGETAPRLIYVTDLLADHGKAEINDVIAANSKKQRGVNGSF
jgi:hypothetical protein